MKNKPITAVFEQGLPNLYEFEKFNIEYQEWNSDSEYELRIPYYVLNHKQKNLVLSYCSGSTIEYIQNNEPDYVIFWK